MRNFAFPGRSPVYGKKAMAATSHPAATLVAVETMRKGGNAVDAAIAATAMMCVVEPAMTGIGGDCFALIAKPGEPKPIALNGSGRAPAAATAEWYAAKGIKQIEMMSPHAVTIPGAIDAWSTLLADHGTMTLGQVLAPAIEAAEGGFPVQSRVAYDWLSVKDKIAKNAGARQHLLKDGRVPAVGEVMRFPALARTLRTIADKGRDGFYAGEVAADIVAEMRELGGLHTLEDFAAQKASYVEPIMTSYKGVDLWELPPNNQGIVALVMLNVLSRLGVTPGNPVSVERYHVIAETTRLAFDARDQFVADPEMAKVPAEQMLSSAFADDLARRIDRKVRKADLGPMPNLGGGDTIYMTVVDEKGMAVSFINSVFKSFGSGMVTKKTGVVLHNRGQGFVLDPKHPNCIAPRKRPMHTLVPAMAMKDGKPWMTYGVMGANFQPMGHVYVLTNMLDYGMDPQEAIDFPRVFFEDGQLVCEHSVPADVYSGLAALGHPVAWRDDPWGGAQAVHFDHANGVLVGASDARKDGCAMGY